METSNHRAVRGLIILTVTWLCWLGDARAELFGRLPATPGGNDYQAYYDSVLDMTWLADANLAATNTFGVGPINGSGTSNPGAMGFATTASYIAAMNAAEYLGFSNWQLPTVAPIDGASFNYASQNDGTSDRGYNLSAPGTAYAGSTASPLAHLYFNTLSNVAFVTPSGTPNSCASAPSPFCLTDTGPFSNIAPTVYWIGTPYSPNPTGAAWGFHFGAGEQSAHGQNLGGHVWPVLTGDAVLGVCGDANGDTRITASDALAALLTAVALDECPLCLCDTDDSSGVTATDARTILVVSVGLPADLNCPSPC